MTMKMSEMFQIKFLKFALNCKILANLRFAKRNTKQLIDPLLARLFETNWRIRNSSIALISKILLTI
jgi:hypothetical protein